MPKASTKIPVMGHSEGICHVYIDKAADPTKAAEVAVDAKVCVLCSAVQCGAVRCGVVRFVFRFGLSSALFWCRPRSVWA